jgi:hypothetical protein
LHHSNKKETCQQALFKDQRQKNRLQTQKFNLNVKSPIQRALSNLNFNPTIPPNLLIFCLYARARAVYPKYEFSYFSETSQQISNDEGNYASGGAVE